MLIGWAKPIWGRFQRRQATGWPTIQGRIESVSVKPKKQFLLSTTPRGRAPAFVAELAYSYSVEGQYHSGHYDREFGSEEEGWEFVRDLQGKSVMVSYNPRNASKSTLSEDGVTTLLNTRPPAPEGSEFQVPVSGVPVWVKPLLWQLVVLAAIGFFLSLWIHLGAVMGKRVAPEAFFWGLHVGAIAIWFPAVFVAQHRVGSLNRRDFWKIVLRSAPDWRNWPGRDAKSVTRPLWRKAVRRIIGMLAAAVALTVFMAVVMMILAVRHSEGQARAERDKVRIGMTIGDVLPLVRGDVGIRAHAVLPDSVTDKELLHYANLMRQRDGNFVCLCGTKNELQNLTESEAAELMKQKMSDGYDWRWRYTFVTATPWHLSFTVTFGRDGRVKNITEVWGWD
jgi:hypothetical protein